MKQVYRITYPTGKIYIGKDIYGSHRYIGSPDSAVVNADFANLSEEQRRDYLIRKEILCESDTATEIGLRRPAERIERHRDPPFEFLNGAAHVPRY